MTAKPNTITTHAQPAPTPRPLATKDDLPPAPSKDEKPAEGTYVVANASVAPWGNGRKAKVKFGEKARMYAPSEVVSLPHALARHYVKLGRLAPYIPEDD